MLLLRTVLGALTIGVASSLRNCDNCIQNSDDVARNSEDEIENHPNLHLLPEECGPIEKFRIYGGNHPSLYEFPWLVLIAHRTARDHLKFFYGGSVINNRYVLTAAHCIKDNIIVSVRIGEYDMSKEIDCYGEGPERICESKIQDIDVAEKIIHPEYSKVITPSFTVVNDIGLLRLKEPIDFSYKNAAAICLPVFKDLREMDLSTEFATVAGWARSKEENQTRILRKITMRIYSTENCIRYYHRLPENNSASDWIKNYIILNRIFNNNLESTLCAGDTDHDSCIGDTGGPLMGEYLYKESKREVQYGIESYGPLCGSSIPRVYTDVRKFMKWILDNIKP